MVITRRELKDRIRIALANDLEYRRQYVRFNAVPDPQTMAEKLVEAVMRDQPKRKAA